MDKKALRSIKRPCASSDLLQIANQINVDYFIEAGKEEENLQIVYYKVSELKKGNPNAYFRTFFSNDDYINQNLETENTKWFTSSLENMWELGLYEYDHIQNIIKANFILDDHSYEILCDYFSVYIDEDDKKIPWKGIERFQSMVKKKRLVKKHKKELDEIDMQMSRIKEVPEDFEEWIFEKAMADRRYLVYRTVSKKKADCYCTRCGCRSYIDRSAVSIRHNEKVVCPSCGNENTAKSYGKMSRKLDDSKYISLVQATEEGFVWRVFCAHLSFSKSTMSTEQELFEMYRTFYTMDGKEFKSRDYEWAEYKQSGKVRWCNEIKNFHACHTVLYPNNLPKEWEHTEMRYSSLEILSRNNPTVSTAYERGIPFYLKYPRLEHIIKMGLYNLAFRIIPYHFGNIDLYYEADTIYQVLGLTKYNTRLLQDMNGSYEHIKILRRAQEKGIVMNQDILQRYTDVFGFITGPIDMKPMKISIHKFIKYFERESVPYGCHKHNIFTDWADYIGWIRDLGHDLNNCFHYLPNNFKNVHDRVMREHMIWKDKKEKEKQRLQEAKVKKLMKVAKKSLDKLFTDGTYSSGDFMILIPKNAEEIKKEGSALHHCVATYVDKVAKGETIILFVRKKEEPDVPFYTMEWKEGRIKQCRGSRNAGMTNDVKQFVDVFEYRMQHMEEVKTA